MDNLVEKAILEQLVILSQQVGEIRTEMRDGLKRIDEEKEQSFKEQDKKIENIQDVTSKIVTFLERTIKRTSKISNDFKIKEDEKNK